MQPRRALALAGICILAAGCSSHSTEATPTATVSTSATTSTAATPLAEAALDGLLLSPAEINGRADVNGGMWDQSPTPTAY
jgi:hypothetical protein